MANIRYYTLKNNGAFVARMQVIWSHNDGQGNESHGTFEPDGYHDICIWAERTIDLSQAHIPEGATVTLNAIVVWGTDNKATQSHVYNKASGGSAVYEISGTTLNNTMSETSCG